MTRYLLRSGWFFTLSPNVTVRESDNFIRDESLAYELARSRAALRATAEQLQRATEELGVAKDALAQSVARERFWRRTAFCLAALWLVGMIVSGLNVYFGRNL